MNRDAFYAGDITEYGQPVRPYVDPYTEPRNDMRITAEEARGMRKASYTLDEIYDFIRSRASDSGMVYGYREECMPMDIVTTLEDDGYTCRKRDDGTWEISWAHQEPLAV